MNKKIRESLSYLSLTRLNELVYTVVHAKDTQKKKGRSISYEKL